MSTLADPAPTITPVSGGARAVARCRALTRPPYSAADDMLFRAYLTPAHAAALDRVGEWMREAGMATRIDPAGNLIGRYEGLSDAPMLLIGSHVDSVVDGGAFDGALGVMLGIECVAALSAKDKRPPFAIEVIAFGDEEGSRFPASMLTSRAAAGTLDPAALAIADRAGVTLDDALAGFGLDVGRFASAPYRRGEVRAYLEAHIEQGPALEAEGLALGVVTAIAGQKRFAARFTGIAGHAGTSSMALRRDALAAAAEAMMAIERIARDGQNTGTPDLVATVGVMNVAPGAPNVIPGRADFTIDVRAGADADRDAALEKIAEAIAGIAAARDLEFSLKQTQVLPASPCDPALTDLLAQAVAATGQAPRRLVSGAGHDAMTMAALAPTAMLFIRCTGGISHNPAEDVTGADVELALAAMLGFVEKLAA